MRKLPSNRVKVLEHLLKLGSITPVEALIVHKIARLAPRILELRREGFRIQTDTMTDEAGDKYTRYSI